MPDLNLDLNYLEHPKVMLISEELGDWAEMLPIRLWLFTAKFHSETGTITGHSVNLIERHLKWKGEKGEGIAILLKYKFLDVLEGGGYAVHDFLKHQGHIAALKERGRRNARKRWDKIANDASSNATSIPESITNSNAPQEEGIEGNKDSSILKMPFNSGIHPELEGPAKRILAIYESVVKSGHASGRKAHTAIMETLAEFPAVREEDLIRSIHGYAAKYDAGGKTARHGAFGFFSDQIWQGFLDSKPPKEARKPLTNEELAKLTS